MDTAKLTLIMDAERILWRLLGALGSTTMCQAKTILYMLLDLDTKSDIFRNASIHVTALCPITGRPVIECHKFSTPSFHQTDPSFLLNYIEITPSCLCRNQMTKCLVSLTCSPSPLLSKSFQFCLINAYGRKLSYSNTQVCFTV